MATSNGTIYSALLAAQKEMGPLLKNATNPHFRNKYADLSAVIETISDPLQNNGLVFYQTVESIVSEQTVSPILHTVIADTKTGEKIESNFPIVCKDPQNPQAIGGAITYLRRYSLMAMLGLAPEDDDGHAASQRPQPKTENKPEPRKELEQFVDTTTGEIEDSTSFNEAEEKNALMRHIMALAKDLSMPNENVKTEMWAAYAPKDVPEEAFSRNQLTLTQMTAYRDELSKRKAKKDIK